MKYARKSLAVDTVRQLYDSRLPAANKINTSKKKQNEKSAHRRRKHCALAVVRRSHEQTNKQTNITHKQTDRADYNTLRCVARSVTNKQ